MGATDVDRPSLSLRDLRRALGTVGAGFVVASLCSLGMANEAGQRRIDLAALVGLGIALVGLHDLRLAVRVPELEARRRTALTVVAVAFVANLATVVPALHAAMSIAAGLAEAVATVLVVVLVGRTMTLARGDELAARWSRLTRVWLVVGAIAVAFVGVAVVVVADTDWPSWFSVAAIALGIVYLAAVLWTIDVGTETLRWLDARAEPELRSARAEPVEPIEARGGGARLGRRGDTLIYYVDPPA